MVPVYDALAGVTVPPEKLHSRTAIVLAALTRMFASKPASSPLGNPGATDLPTAAPVRGKVRSGAHDPLAIAPKLSVAEAVRNVGTAAESTAMLVLEPVSTVIIPVAPLTLFPLRRALLSAPPVLSQVPLVAVQVNNGIESTGNAVTPADAEHGDVHVSVRLWPAVNVPLESTYT